MAKNKAQPTQVPVNQGVEPTPAFKITGLNYSPVFVNELSADAPQALRNIPASEFTYITCLNNPEDQSIRKLSTLEKYKDSLPPGLYENLEKIAELAPSYTDEVPEPGFQIVAGFGQICATEDDTFYVFFHSVVENYPWLSLVGQVEAAGGGGIGDPHLAIIKPNHELVIHQNLGDFGKRISFKNTETPSPDYTPQPGDVKEETIEYRQDAGYYTCRSMIGLRGDHLYVECGGGDGGLGVDSLVAVNVETGIQDDIFHCRYILKSAFCKDENNRMYIKR